MKFLDLPKDMLLLLGSFLDYHAVAGLAGVARGSNKVFDSNQLWRPMYFLTFGEPVITSESKHIGPVRQQTCRTASDCKITTHYKNVSRAPIHRKYANYKKQFARRQETREKYELKRFYQDLHPFDHLSTLQVEMRQHLAAIRRLQHKFARARRMLFVKTHGVNELYAFAHEYSPRVRKKKKQRLEYQPGYVIGGESSVARSQ